MSFMQLGWGYIFNTGKNLRDNPVMWEKVQMYIEKETGNKHFIEPHYVP